MTKTEFLEKLRKELSGLPKSEIDELVAFYGEMIDDRMEEGLTEEDAVNAAGSIEQIVSQAINDTMLAKIAKERIKPKRKLTALEIVLLAIGSPIWISLAVSVIAVIFALYISLWSIIVAAYAVFAAIIATIVGSFASGIILLCKAFVLQGFAYFGAGIFFLGLSVFAFYGCKAATKGIIHITKNTVLWLKHRLIKKEAV